MYLVSLHGQETSFWPGSSGMPTECIAGTKAASVSSILRSTLVPMRAMTLIDTTTYAESVISTPNIGLSASRWPMHEGHDVHRAAPHAAPVELGHDRLHLLRVHPVVGGPRVLLVDRADEGAVLDARDVGGVGLGEERVGLDLRVEPGEGAALDERGGQRLPLGVVAGAPVDPVGLGQLGDLADPGQDALVGRRARGVRGGRGVGRHANRVLSRISSVGNGGRPPSVSVVWSGEMKV